MAQELKEIIAIVKDKAAESMDLSPLSVLSEVEQDQITSKSIVSEWGRFTYVFSWMSMLQQKIFDAFTKMVENRIDETKVHNKSWYRLKALAYQHGYDLIDDTDKYPVAIDLTDQIQIDASKVIKQAAIVKRGNSVLRCKIATTNGDDLAPVSAEVLNSFKYYMEEIADAGTTVLPTTSVADTLKIVVNISYNPLVLNSRGERLDGNDLTPAQDAAKAYLKSLAFNGKLVVQNLENFIKTPEGIEVVDIEYVSSKYGLYSYATVGISNAGIINQFRIAEAGYMKLDEVESEFNFIEYND